jgi:hypothetical protein
MILEKWWTLLPDEPPFLQDHRGGGRGSGFCSGTAGYICGILSASPSRPVSEAVGEDVPRTKEDR